MIRYFARVPAAAVFRHVDGHRYAHVNIHVHSRGVYVTDVTRMLMADDAKIENGVARIYVGSMGEAIAQLENLPFGVVWEKVDALLLVDNGREAVFNTDANRGLRWQDWVERRQAYNFTVGAFEEWCNWDAHWMRTDKRYWPDHPRA